MTTSEIVGIYSVAVQLSNMLWLLPDAFKDVMTFKTSKEDSIKEIVLVTKYCLYLAFIILILFIIGGKLFIYIAYGKEFIDSYGVTAILLFGSLSMVLYKIIHPLYIAKGKQWIILKILFASTIINVILNILLIPRIGMLGSALASVCSYTTCGYVFLIKFCKEYNVRMKEFFKINKEDIKRNYHIVFSDNVDHPNHYAGKYECIDIMESLYGTEAVKDFCLLNAFKYIWRTQKKNGLEDIKKAIWYMKKYVKLSEGDESNDIS